MLVKDGALMEGLSGVRVRVRGRVRFRVRGVRVILGLGLRFGEATS